MTLWEIKNKQSAMIDSLDATLVPAIGQRLNEMGFASGQLIQCLRRSPLKGPLVLQLGDCVYSLEQSIATRINITAA
ncbi:MAG: ferrous iron transport protein A [Paraglaciecola sp.]|uniref:FeoA family protein n=1 Tax=Pseudomonadati TaxID=3379134 RepID=UPI00273F3969|nr:FeoA family protein [Paraglaciecola sp.]MDP5030825.1 ferrous iron transport protein A [Paraglaciecola sp.]MDP5041175.1 ferrous iron transport protein A [Paraglaciecola sp.]MDP5129550.1 ferrous iron transport protein A [Paraglaciecola sp.]